MLNTCKSNVVFGELGRRKRGSQLKVACLAQEVGTVENKVANGCVTRGNLPNSSGPNPEES